MISHIQGLVLSFGLLWSVGAFASDNMDYGVPSADCVVDRIGYALGYSEEHEQARWVMYRMTREEVLVRETGRTDDCKEDPNIVSFSALPSDYSRSGYVRGHLAPRLCLPGAAIRSS